MKSYYFDINIKRSFMEILNCDVFVEKLNINQIQIKDWECFNVKYIDYMFSLSNFNNDISRWDVSNVKTMNSMFENVKMFNQNISNLDVSNIVNMSLMFDNSIFNQDIFQWNVSSIVFYKDMFNNCQLEKQQAK